MQLIINKTHMMRMTLRDTIYNKDINIAILMEYIYKNFPSVKYNKYSSNTFKIDITLSKEQMNEIKNMEGNLYNNDITINNYPIVNNIFKEFLYDNRIYSQLSESFRIDLKELEPGGYIMLVNVCSLLDNTITILL